MKIQNCDRNGCYTLRGQYLRYEHIIREYRCQCGRSLSQVAVSQDYVVTHYRLICQDCGEIDDIIHYNTDFERMQEAAEVLNNLPPEFAALIVPDKEPDNLQDIINVLF